MADTVTKAKRSQIMAAVRSRGNKATELRFIKILREYKITGWRRNQRLFGNPDFVFNDSRVAIFVDGCFWHGCSRHLRMPLANHEYWERKIQRNQRRDRQAVRALRGAGWRVVRVWEHELRFSGKVALRLTKVLRATGPGPRPGPAAEAQNS